MADPNRYSQVVTLGKVILPLLALGLLSTLFLLSRTPDPDQAIPFAEVDVEELAREPRLGQPRFAGTLADGRAIVFVAERAVPAAGAPNQITADGIEARVDLSPETVLLISSRSGLIDMNAQTADLQGDVGLILSSGYRLQTNQLLLNMDLPGVNAPAAVELTGPGMSLTAGGMEATGGPEGYVVVFNGGVRVLYEPES